MRATFGEWLIAMSMALWLGAAAVATEDAPQPEPQESSTAAPAESGQETESAESAAPTESTGPAEPAPLPEFDQAEIVRGQRERLEPIRQQLRVMLHAGESDHFLLFSDLDSRVRNAVLIWLEDSRAKLIAQLGIDPRQRLWDGKCLVLVFAKQESLAAFAEEFDDHHVQKPRGYFVMESRRSTDPRLVHVATFQPIRGGNEALREVLVHETTHALIELYRKSAPLPLWVHEGLAEYMTVLMDPTLRPAKQAGAFTVATATPYAGIQDIFTRTFAADNLAAYSVSMSLIECLYSIDASGVLHLVEALKDGVEPEQALGRAYPGLTYAELERRWQTFCMRFYRPAVKEDKGR